MQADIVALSWRYLPVVLSSSLLMLAFAMIWNNLGRRRYPQHFWAPGKTFVREEIPDDQAMEEARKD